MKTGTLTYTLTRQAWADYSLYCLFDSPFTRRAMLAGQFVPPLLVMAACALFYLTGHMTAATACTVSAVTYGIFVFFFRPLFRKRVKRWVDRQIDGGMGSGFIGEHFLELKENAIRDAQGESVVEVPYASVKNMVENRGCLYVFIDRTTAFVIPLDALDGEGGRADFLAALAEKGVCSGAA